MTPDDLKSKITFKDLPSNFGRRKIVGTLYLECVYEYDADMRWPARFDVIGAIKDRIRSEITHKIYDDQRREMAEALVALQNACRFSNVSDEVNRVMIAARHQAIIPPGAVLEFKGDGCVGAI